MTWRRRVFALAALAALSIVAGGACRKAEEEAGRVTLRVVNWAQDLELRSEQRIADRFAERHPGVRVVVESVAGDNYGVKLVTAIASRNPPDVFLLDVPDIPDFVERGLLIDLAPHLTRLGYDPDSVFPKVLAVFKRGERVHAFPKDFTPMVIYLNLSLFDRLGVPAPPERDWTWDEFLEVAKALRRDEDGDGKTDIYAIDFPRRLYEWVAWVWSGGGDILGGEDRRATGYLDSAATVNAFRFLTSLVTIHEVTPPVQFATGDAARTSRFYTGKQGMLLSGHWSLPLIDKYARRGKLEIGIAPIPHARGHPPATVIYAAGWAVPQDAPHPELALELAAFLGGEEAQRLRAPSRIGIPALKAVAEEMAENDRTGLERAFLREVAKGRMPWGSVVMGFHEVERLSRDIMDRHLLNGEDLAQAAADVARTIDERRSR